jgi:broad specificity phosphatase PhoE
MDIGFGRQQPSYTSLISSHNSRIQCLINKFKPKITKTRIRFQNCCILRLEISENYFSLRLVYSGELSDHEQGKVSKKKRPYYTTPDKADPENGYFSFGHIQANQDTMWMVTERLNISESNLLGNKFVFYIVRHGQGEHNVKNSFGFSETLGLKRDTPVTQIGLDQATKAGEELRNILSEYREKIDYYFASDLERTRQTLLNVYVGLYKRNDEIQGMEISEESQQTQQNPKPDKIVILPCAHEPYAPGSGDGDCDAYAAKSSWLSKKSARENYPKCTIDAIRSGVPGCSSIDGVPLDWTFYLQFYGDQIRSQMLMSSSGRRYCRDTTMISTAIDYILNKSHPVYEEFAFTRRSFGGKKTRKSRKTRKTRKSRKTRKTRKSRKIKI